MQRAPGQAKEQMKAVIVLSQFLRYWYVALLSAGHHSQPCETLRNP
jgi:hypothetical protein